MSVTTLLLILDGWGHAETIDHNAIAMAHTPTYDHLLKTCPHAWLDACGESVGLPPGQMGNSEVGHLHIGAGRQVRQSLLKINQAIQTDDFYQNVPLITTMRKTKQTIHIIGLLSPGGVHSHQDHLLALTTMAAQQGHTNIAVHAILDGRDTPPQSALNAINTLDKHLKELGSGHIASLCGRYYAMDRDNRWDRTQQAYDLYTQDKYTRQAASAQAALQLAYEQNETDEFVKPTAITPNKHTMTTIQDHDVVILANFRADRMRQITQALTIADFTEFSRSIWPQLAACTTMTHYQEHLPVTVAFPQETLQHTLGECIAQAGLAQCRITETEKFAHVTYFLNGGNETVFPQEDRILIPSEKVATYDLAPDMQAHAITDAIINTIQQQKHQVIISNLANADMVGHTGNLPATIQAIETIDSCLNKILTTLKQHQGQAIITADHGNAETLYDPTQQQPHTAHTNNPVPMIYVGRPATSNTKGMLTDIAPSLLTCLDLAPPKEMTGQSLLQWI